MAAAERTRNVFSILGFLFFMKVARAIHAASGRFWNSMSS